MLTQIDTLEEAITGVSNEIATRMQEVELAAQDDADKGQDQDGPKPDQSPLTWAQAVTLLCTIPGISRRAAEGILAEIGLDMDRFPSSGHLASWAGMCPGNQ
ncbi:MAG TPA: IS110 family transposase [Ktedonobacteraceae bacterium]|nr:IS110 family transposase [Ktedonobacteraceae bacterium]